MYTAITKKRYFDSEENGAYDCQNRLKVSLFPFQNVMIIFELMQSDHVYLLFEPRLEISINVVCATKKGSDQPVILIRAFASRLNIIGLLSYCPNTIWNF